MSTWIEQAPDGQTWVCAACGRNGKLRSKIGDESCFLNAVLCYDRGGVLSWEAVPGVDKWGEPVEAQQGKEKP